MSFSTCRACDRDICEFCDVPVCRTEADLGSPPTTLCKDCDDSFLEPEEYAYPHGGLTRKGLAWINRNPHNPIELPYGEQGRVLASIPDTYFSIPARLLFQGKRVRGFLTIPNGTAYVFTPEANPDTCTKCASGDGCKKHEQV